MSNLVKYRRNIFQIINKGGENMSRVSLRKVKAFRNGSKEAFEEIFYAYKDILFYIAFFYVKDYDEANDCVQDSFLRIVEKINLFDERKGDFDSWVFAVAKTCILNHIRAKNRYQDKIFINEEIVFSYPDHQSDIDDILNDLANLMGKDMYLVYILRTSYEISFELISKLTGINRETARRMYYKSLEIVEDYMRGIKNENEQKSKRIKKEN